MHEKNVEAPQAHQRHVPMDTKLRMAEEVPQVEFFDTAALETPRLSQPYVPMVLPMPEIVMEAPQVHQRYVPMVQPMPEKAVETPRLHQRHVPMAAQASSSPLAVGDVVVIVWPSHRAHGHKGSPLVAPLGWNVWRPAAGQRERSANDAAYAAGLAE